MEVAIAAIKKARKMGKARTGELRRVIRKIEEERKVLEAKAVSLRWVKSHIGITNNKEADKRAKLGTNKEDSAFPIIMEGGLKDVWKGIRKEEKCVRGTGGGRVVSWERKAKVLCVHCKSGNRNLQS